MAFVLVTVPDTVWAATGKVSVSVSSGNVNIGDSVTASVACSGPNGNAVATVTLTYDAGILEVVGCSTTYGGGGGSVRVAGDTFTVTFKAISAGTSSLTVSGSDGVDFSSGEELESMTGSSTSVTVNNAASTGGGTGTGAGTGNGGGGTGTGTGTGNGGGGTGTGTGTGNGGGGTGTGTGNGGGNAALSADNSLKSLTISPGTLSPAFSGRTTSYTATVGNDVTSIAVSAVPANAKAVVESVTGNSSLQVGSNTIRIVVKAENGVTATYTIGVTRQSAGAVAEPSSEAEPEPGEEQETVTVAGMQYQISEKFSAEDVPADFVESTIAYHGTEYRGVSFTKGLLGMLWLSAGEGEESFFIYDETRDSLYPFVRLGSEERYVIALLAPVDAVIPEDYLQVSLMLDGKNTATVFQKDNGESEIVSEFYRFYGVNYEGIEGWYQFDAREGTYQRVNTAEEVVVSTEELFDVSDELEALSEDYAELFERYSSERTSARNTIGVLVFVIAVLIVIIINLLIFRFRRRTDELEDEDIDEDDLDETGQMEDHQEVDFMQGDYPKGDTGTSIQEEIQEKSEQEESWEENSVSEKGVGDDMSQKNEKENDDLDIIDFNDL